MDFKNLLKKSSSEQDSLRSRITGSLTGSPAKCKNGESSTPEASSSSSVVTVTDVARKTSAPAATTRLANGASKAGNFLKMGLNKSFDTATSFGLGSMNKWDKFTADAHPRLETLPSVPLDDDVVVVEMDDESSIMTKSEAEVIAEHLPARLVGNTWHLLFSTEKHGCLLKTIYERVKREENLGTEQPSVLLIRDINRNRFGAYLSHTLKISEKCYGSGETFVFKFDGDKMASSEDEAVKPEANVDASAEEKEEVRDSNKENKDKANDSAFDDENDSSNTSCSEDVEAAEVKNPQIFKWTGHKDNSFIFGTPSSLRVGLDHGSDAIFVDEMLSHGRSQECGIFNSPSLTPTSDFEAETVELWTFIH